MNYPWVTHTLATQSLLSSHSLPPRHQDAALVVDWVWQKCWIYPEIPVPLRVSCTKDWRTRMPLQLAVPYWLVWLVSWACRKWAFLSSEWQLFPVWTARRRERFRLRLCQLPSFAGEKLKKENENKTSNFLLFGIRTTVNLVGMHEIMIKFTWIADEWKTLTDRSCKVHLILYKNFHQFIYLSTSITDAFS